jgi:sulfite reductase (NADPH) flavoprotein alpha-component
MPGTDARIIIGYGSESGNAQGLTQRLLRQAFLQPFELVAQDLNSLDLNTLRPTDRLVIVSSSFGDGEPPANAERFLEHLSRSGPLAHLRYAIFGLGDTTYPTFCGFTKGLDRLLQDKHASAFINRVDADSDFEDFFNAWCTAFDAVLHGDSQAGTTLYLQVSAYGEQAAFASRVIACTPLNKTPPHAYQVRLDIEGSGIRYRAGDNLHVLAPNDPHLLADIAHWLGDDSAVQQLRTKELRQLSKAVLREIARLCSQDSLKNLLKVSNRKALETYLYGKDLLDILTDFCSPSSITLLILVEVLTERLPRAYSIASHSHPQHVDLCIREVTYTLAGRQRVGTASGHLAQAQPKAEVDIFARSNPRFHLPKGSDFPLVLIGAGTGIAPLIGLLEQRELEGAESSACLIFGDRRRASDFLYQERIARWQGLGILEQVFTAFSRDGEWRYYVQDAIVEHGAYLWQLLEQGAHLYLCGNKHNLENAIDQALVSVAGTFGQLSHAAAEEYLANLNACGRVHKELY